MCRVRLGFSAISSREEKRREEKMDVALFSPSSLFAEEDDVTVGTHFLFYISSISFYFACRKMNIVFFFSIFR